MTKGLLIDLDNTLYSYEECHQAGLSSSLKQFQKHHPDISKELFLTEYSLIKSDLKIKLPKVASSHHRLFYFQSILEKFQVWQPTLCLELYHSYWNSFLDTMELFDEALSFLKCVRAKNIPIVIVTDLVAQIQYEKIIRLGIEQYVDFIVTSEEVGIEKPSKEIFNAALNKIKCKACDVIMVGDNFDKDITGANDLGIQAFWFDPNKKWRDSSDLSQYKKFSNYKELNELFK